MPYPCLQFHSQSLGLVCHRHFHFHFQHHIVQATITMEGPLPSCTEFGSQCALPYANQQCSHLALLTGTAAQHMTDLETGHHPSPGLCPQIHSQQYYPWPSSLLQVPGLLDVSGQQCHHGHLPEHLAQGPDAMVTAVPPTHAPGCSMLHNGSVLQGHSTGSPPLVWSGDMDTDTTAPPATAMELPPPLHVLPCMDGQHPNSQMASGALHLLQWHIKRLDYLLLKSMISSWREWVGWSRGGRHDIIHLWKRQFDL